MATTGSLSIPQLLAAGAGGILLYSAIKNKNPIDVVKGSIAPNPDGTNSAPTVAGTGSTTGTNGQESPSSVLPAGKGGLDVNPFNESGPTSSLKAPADQGFVFNPFAARYK